ncbi:putative disease resistance RPP13-like protein 1 [Eucalyptus grandis]|uniref:putative disease resistance RPP13-like protein 1 n=1 Tax=Eucalyptus grandis TaxID=71139 RepID=UPI00192E96B9|nr:putative disease resistance RPP13-like protein 1 [Eucalyptus grandis]XP_039163618.1 putative disease resistance RPP13-like protein 1 [Eucalyptus grandis]XP_039163619.1 putative disease resistance RPP13-like protein 1 [Eucalyptus grandis]XP_039163620.1 putative disease resistance RPP13-like protein 1 [Eucalyptus grandis]XP_039163621.1 putative disease resistance RPP13-like protein 1 [Eucalyptus grandis]XP_039163622.1 putative disease resistance RPP13-like protein 1 [Eucalyptus grandis]XP_03
MDIRVIPIVGMPGLGKTALAQQVFNDARVTSYFDAKAWACVSDDFNMLAITKSILQKINCTLACDDKDLDWLQDKLKENLSGKKFLVVLDDIWNESYEKWTNLLKPFQSGAKGSKIIITTRNFPVAKIASARPYTLEVLSQDACVTLFAFHALRVENFDHHPNLEALGLKIVEKCKGLPLAVKTLAGLLRTKVSSHEWESILNSKIWDLPSKSNDILPALKLSYLHLPSNLRRCFAYCAIFPKDYEIQRDQLIHWWIANGFVDGKEAKNQWNAGLNYFNELVNRSLFQRSSSNESRFLMHDLVNDLAKLAAGASHYCSEEFEFDVSLVRHASFLPSKYIVLERLKIYHWMQGLRSFISLNKPYRFSNVSQKVLCDLLSKLKYLRVLSLSYYNIYEVLDCIGKLRHLRHLNLSHTYIRTLPKSIVALHNLEALMLQGCELLIELPEGMEKLINLRFLDITNTRSLEKMPLYVGNLAGLEMLSKFIVGTGNGSRLKELKNLENLRGELCISNLHTVKKSDAGNANLCTKKEICQLTMQWSTDFENFRNEELEGEVLKLLHPHQNLENLKISYYGGLEFPSWLGSSSHVNIVCLRLHRCQRIKALPSLGQLSSLKGLYIEGLDEIRLVGSEFRGSKNPFPSLLTLEFKDMPLWVDWSHCIDTEEVGVVFPRLEDLVIQDCPMLIGRLPSQLSSLIKLKIYSCPCMDASLTITSLPSLNELDFRGCNEGVLKSLINLTSLTVLLMENVAELTCLNHGFASSLIKLEKLEIEKCTKLIYLWQDGDVIRNLNCLKRLVICRCPKFIYFVAKGDIELPSNLETIKLENCINLEKLPNEVHTLSSLRDLVVKICPKLVSFPEIGIPTSLISLNIRDCEMLQSLPRGLSAHLDEPSSNNSNTHNDIISCLQDLRISGCSSLPSSPFSEGIFLLTALKRLVIHYCKGVESLAEIHLDPLQSIQEIEIRGLKNLISLPQGLHTLSRLTWLALVSCPSLEMECFPPLPPSISIFLLLDCPKIKSLPNQLHGLTRSLSILGCKRLTRFPEGGLPPQLERLWVSRCENIKQPISEWLTPLTSLERLDIDGSVGGVGEEEDLVLPLPSSLLHLYLWDVGKVERLSSSLLPSLRSLEISNCPKLRELPQDGLPPSLEMLKIVGCVMLEERCKKGTGCYWPLICEIPRIVLGGRSII